VSPYLRPTAPLAADVLLPADPGLAMAIAQRVLTKPAMANHHHGLWGYSGTTPDGHALTIQATGVGGASAAAVLGELAGHGARRAVRIGRCAALAHGPEAGRRVVAIEALGADGVSMSLDATRPRPDAALTASLGAIEEALCGVVASSDLPAAAQGRRAAEWERDGAAAVDLETAALLALGERLELSVAAVLVVTESESDRLDDDEADRELVELAAEAALALRTLPASAAGR
jgi:uridine phosphorylase